VVLPLARGIGALWMLEPVSFGFGCGATVAIGGAAVAPPTQPSLSRRPSTLSTPFHTSRDIRSRRLCHQQPRPRLARSARAPRPRPGPRPRPPPHRVHFWRLRRGERSAVAAAARDTHAASEPVSHRAEAPTPRHLAVAKEPWEVTLHAKRSWLHYGGTREDRVSRFRFQEASHPSCAYVCNCRKI